VALLVSILSYPEAENAANILNKQDELHWRKEKYIRVERAITDLGKVVDDDRGICCAFPGTASVEIFVHTIVYCVPVLVYCFSSPDLDGVWRTRWQIYYGSYAGQVRRSRDRKMGTV